MSFLTCKVQSLSGTAGASSLASAHLSDITAYYSLARQRSQTFLKMFIFIYRFEGEEEDAGRHTSICCSTCLRIHWLSLVCSLPGNRTYNLGVLGQN